jgi:hypothetical protein
VGRRCGKRRGERRGPKECERHWTGSGEIKNQDSAYIFVGRLIRTRSERDCMDTEGIKPGISEAGQRKQIQLLRTVYPGNLGH